MTTRLKQRGFLSGRPGRQIFAAAVVTAVAVVAASVYVWIDLGGGAMYGEARVKEAEFHPPDRLRLILDTCYELISNRSVSATYREVKVEVVGFSTFPRGTGCRDYFETRLESPLGDRPVIDGHTGKAVTVRTVK